MERFCRGMGGGAALPLGECIPLFPYSPPLGEWGNREWPFLAKIYIQPHPQT